MHGTLQPGAHFSARRDLVSHACEVQENRIPVLNLVIRDGSRVFAFILGGYFFLLGPGFDLLAHAGWAFAFQSLTSRYL